MMAAVLVSPQQINLYNPTLLPSREQFSARQLAIWVVIAVAALAAVAWWATGQMRSLMREMAEQARAPSKGPVGPTQQNVEAMEKALRDKLALLEARRATRDALRRGMAGPDAGPSAVLRRIADTIPPTAWVLEVKVAGSRIDIKGRALDPAAVDAWLERLRGSGFITEKPLPNLRVDRIEPAAGPGKGPASYGIQISATLAAPFAEEGGRP